MNFDVHGLFCFDWFMAFENRNNQYLIGSSKVEIKSNNNPLKPIKLGWI